MIKPKLLVVDDDDMIRTQLKWALCNDYDVLLAGEREAAISIAMTHRPAVAVLDLGLPPSPNSPEEGFRVLRQLQALVPGCKVLIVSGQSETEDAVEAVANGAYDFFCKPVELDELKVVLRRCYHVAELDRQGRDGREGNLACDFHGIMGTSESMKAVFSFIRKVSAVSAPVLLLGESGTGKEMVAVAIHRSSVRKNGPFQAINCNAIPENLLESELFGYEKGAFTGAQSQRAGLIETATGGTLFLDEIGDIPHSIQVKLLRFLQEKRFQRVGGRQELQADVRVLTATNANLEEEVRKGRFREDLYFRLAVLVLMLPPLRERAEDIPMLANEFLRRFLAESGKAEAAFSADALGAMSSYQWPGNVRELQNRIRRGLILAEGRRITAKDLDLSGAEDDEVQSSLREARENVERDMVLRALRSSGGKVSAAAARLGVSRPTLYELMEKLHVDRENLNQAFR